MPSVAESGHAPTDEARSILNRDGRVWFRQAIDQDDLRRYEAACDELSVPGRRIGAAGAFRVLLDRSSQLGKLAGTLLEGADPVRLVAFDKSPTVNWHLPWHQDRVIALRDRRDVPGYRSWTRKAGFWHAEPPIELLEEMIFARLHLDDATVENGCMEIALGTHRLGRVDASEASRLAEEAPREMCIARRGDVLFVKALMLHRSGRSRSKAPRRALRVDYCAAILHPSLQWAFLA